MTKIIQLKNKAYIRNIKEIKSDLVNFFEELAMEIDISELNCEYIEMLIYEVSKALVRAGDEINDIT